MNEEQIKEEMLRLNPLYSKIQSMHIDESSLNSDIENTQMALDYGIDLPDYTDPTIGEVKSADNCNVGLEQYLKILLLVKKDRSMQTNLDLKTK